MTTPFATRAGFVLALLFATPALALAAEGGGDKSVLSPNLVNSLVTLVVFGALLAILYTVAWGPILKGLQAREEAEHKALEEARRAREEAAAMRAELQAERAKAADEIRALMDEARRDAEALRATERETGVREAAAERARARRENEAHAEALRQELTQYAVQLATTLSAKTIRRQLTPDDHRRLLDEALAEMGDGARHRA